MRPVDVARYFSKVAAFVLICVAAHSLHVSVTCTTKGVFDKHGGACTVHTSAVKPWMCVHEMMPISVSTM